MQSSSRPSSTRSEPTQLPPHIPSWFHDIPRLLPLNPTSRHRSLRSFCKSALRQLMPRAWSCFEKRLIGFSFGNRSGQTGKAGTNTPSVAKAAILDHQIQGNPFSVTTRVTPAQRPVISQEHETRGKEPVSNQCPQRAVPVGGIVASTLSLCRQVIGQDTRRDT